MNGSSLESHLVYELFDPNDKCVTKVNHVDENRVLFGIIFTIIAVFSLVVILIVTVTVYSVNSTRKIFAYELLNFLNITQLIYLLPTFVVTIPCTITKCPYFTDRLTIWLSWPDTFGLYAGAAINCLIAFERISVFLSPSIHKVLVKYAIIWCSISWLIGAAIVAVSNSIGCHKW
ncbi:unnamed protein product [Enterobius vermicularis]|uniref:G_PROTEIN_RECEP_F1_2 domain-containing protein n=1 Tax=Enterobius vermicularis TaxID=51028 RepID=A0A0N4V2X1_ENTVE|nr:unnamed protein product [Enterobius vermicularis]